jgi:hypothetical protein
VPWSHGKKKLEIFKCFRYKRKKTGKNNTLIAAGSAAQVIKTAFSLFVYIKQELLQGKCSEKCSYYNNKSYMAHVTYVKDAKEGM